MWPPSARLLRLKSISKTVRIPIETRYLLGLAVFDLVFTLLWTRYPGHVEGNPLWSAILAHSLPLFAACKLLSVALPLAILERLRKYAPQTVKRGIWIGAAIYTILLGGAIILALSQAIG